LPIVLLLAAACDVSHVDPNATVVIAGRVLDANGRPLSGVTVHLYKEPDVGEVIVGSVLALGSLGAVCLLPGAPAICSQGTTTTTRNDGSYRFSVQGSDTQGLVGDAAKLDVVFADPTSDRGASTTVRFTAQTTHVRLPAVRLWNARLRVAAHRSGGPVYLPSWSRLPDPDGAAPSYSLQLLDPKDAAQLWAQPGAGTRAVVDARIVEDHPVDVAVTARARLRGVDVIYLSARRPLRAIAGAPPSRNQPCSAVTGTKRIATFPQPDCAVTDGDLRSPARLVAGNHRTVTGVVVDLGASRRVSLIVARGLSGRVAMEISGNGRTYRRVAVTDQPTAAVDPPGTPTARYVRIRSTTGLDESLLTEISVW
jgi:hypothetical protein